MQWSSITELEAIVEAINMMWLQGSFFFIGPKVFNDLPQHKTK